MTEVYIDTKTREIPKNWIAEGGSQVIFVLQTDQQGLIEEFTKTIQENPNYFNDSVKQAVTELNAAKEEAVKCKKEYKSTLINGKYFFQYNKKEKQTVWSKEKKLNDARAKLKTKSDNFVAAFNSYFEELDKKENKNYIQKQLDKKWCILLNIKAKLDWLNFLSI